MQEPAQLERNGDGRDGPGSAMEYGHTSQSLGHADQGNILGFVPTLMANHQRTLNPGVKQSAFSNSH
jgi:hypothetical protein